jgi:hypothetical protein
MDLIYLTEISSTSAFNIQYLEYDNARERMFPCSVCFELSLHGFKTEIIIMFHLYTYK